MSDYWTHVHMNTLLSDDSLFVSLSNDIEEIVTVHSEQKNNT